MNSVAVYITKFTITISVMLISLASALGCGQDKGKEVTFKELFANPGAYNGKEITIAGFFFHGFEVQVLAEKLDYSGYAAGHLVPRGEMIWIEGGIPADIYDQLYQQQIMGPEERYGKVKVTGMFEYGGKYGHIEGYDSQIVPSAVELLEWVGPAPR